MIDGDLLVSDPRCRKPREGDFKVAVASKDAEILEWHSVANMLFNIAVGNVPYYLPYAFKCGVFNAILVCIGCVLMTSLSFTIYLNTWIFGTDNSYSALADASFSIKYGWVFHVILVFTYIGVATNEIHEVQTSFSSIFSSFFTETPAILQSKWIYAVLFPFVLTVPVLFFSSFGKTLPIAYANNAAVLIGFISFIICLIQNVSEYGFNPNDRMKLWGNDFGGTVYCFLLFSTAYFIQPMIPKVASEMKAPTKKRVIKTFYTAMLSNSAINLIQGLAGYFIFFDTLSYENCLYFFSKSTVFVIICKFCNLIIVASNAATFIYMTATDVCRLFEPESEKNPLCRIFAGIVDFLLVCFFGINGDSFLSVLNIVSAVGIMLLTYIIPSAIYLGIRGFKPVILGIASVFLIVIVISETLIYIMT